MKKNFTYLLLFGLALMLCGPVLAAEASTETLLIEAVKVSPAETAEPAAKKDCPARAAASMVVDPFDSLVEAENTLQTTALILPKICPVDCSPCRTAADCIIGGCKAVQCP